MVLKAPKADSMRLRMWKQRMRLCDRLRVEKRERERERKREREEKLRRGATFLGAVALGQRVATDRGNHGVFQV